MNAPLPVLPLLQKRTFRQRHPKSDDASCDCSAETARPIRAIVSGERVVKAGQELLNGDSGAETVCLLVEGWVVLFEMLSDGRRQILQFALPGTFLGLQGCANTCRSAQALTEATVCTLPRRALKALADDEPAIAVGLSRLIARDHALSLDHLTSIGRRTARERVARLLLELFVRWSSRWPEAIPESISLPLTQEHIADATGLTSVHVNRVLNNLRRDAVAEFHHRHLLIVDPRRLIRIAGAGDLRPEPSTWYPTASCPCRNVACIIQHALAVPGGDRRYHCSAQSQ